jgi:hypothetical protein
MPPVHANHLPQQQDQQQYVPNQAPSHATRPDEIVHYFKDTHPIVEGTKQTESLAGTTFVQAANLDYKGNKVLMFVFSVRVILRSYCPACIPRWRAVLTRAHRT